MMEDREAIESSGDSRAVPLWPDGIYTSSRFGPPMLSAEPVIRARLLEPFASLGRGRRIVAVTAGAGCGKSVAAHLGTRGLDHPIRWVEFGQRSNWGRVLVDLHRATAGFHVDGAAAVRAGFEAGCDPSELAAVFADSLRERDLTLVLDNVEVVAADSEALAVLESFIAHVPVSVRFVLISRTPVNALLWPALVGGTAALVTEDDLRLTVDEAEALLASSGKPGAFAGDLVAHTGGWMMACAVYARSQETDGPNIFGLFATYIHNEALAGLTSEQRRFLLVTSIADVVDETLAAELVGEHGRRLFADIVGLGLPSMSIDGGRLTYHPILREYLVRQLAREPDSTHREIRERFAAYLSAHGRLDEAVDLWLELGRRDEAIASIAVAAPSLMQRSDWGTLNRWFDALGEPAVDANLMLVAARIRTLHGERRFREGAAYIHRLEQDDVLEAVFRADRSLVAIAAWILQSDPSAAWHILDTYEGDYQVDAVSFYLDALYSTEPAQAPSGSDWAGAARLVSWAMLWQGRLGFLRRLAEARASGPVDDPNLILGVAWSGAGVAARMYFDLLPTRLRERPHSRLVEAAISLVEGNDQAALESATKAMYEGGPAGNPPVYEAMAAWSLLRLGRTSEAVELIESRLLDPRTAIAMVEWLQTLRGWAYIADGDADAAVAVLTAAVESASGARRRLALSMAAVYLAEAWFQLGDFDAAGKYLATGRDADHEIGRAFWFADALQHCPLSRAALSRDDGPSGATRLVMGSSSVIGVETLGDGYGVFAGGESICARLKVVELLACVALHPQGIERNRLQQRLLPDSDRRRGGNHFRQIVHQMRKSTGIVLDRLPGDRLALPEQPTIVVSDMEFQRLIDFPRDDGAEGLVAVRRAVDLYRGRYLVESELDWAEERRHQLDLLFEDAAWDVAVEAMQRDELDAASHYCEEILLRNPYREEVYRMLMQIEHQRGSPAQLTAQFLRARDALAELGLDPPDDLRALLQQSTTRTAAAG